MATMDLLNDGVPPKPHPYAALWQLHLQGPPRDVWTPQRVALLHPKILIEDLVTLGVSPLLFPNQELARGRRSAWQFAEEEWIPFVESTHPRDLDFARLAACELWKSGLPHEPSQEQLHGHYAALRIAIDSDECDEAFVQGSVFWRLARRALRPEMQVTKDADALLMPGDDFRTFTENFAIATADATARGGSYEAEPIKEMLAQFPAEEAEWRANITCQLAQILVNCNQAEEGERVLDAAFEDFPASGYPYLALVGIAMRSEDAGKMRSTIEVLERGLAILTPKEVRFFDLAEMVDDLRRDFSREHGSLKLVTG